MKENAVTDRLTFLAETFDVFEPSSETDKNILDDKLQVLKKEGYKCSLVKSNDDLILSILSTKMNDKNRLLKKVSVSSDIFSAMITADPTDNKMYLQWMLNVFTRLIKEGTKTSLDNAKRFVLEDLPQANSYLVLFEDNKRKRKFRELCKASYSIKNLEDPTNINQYKSLAQLFDSVDPFIEKEPSAVERTLKKFVDSGQALIPVKDRKFTLYIPKSTDSSVVFDNFANWCTAKKGNSMFTHYTSSYKKPNGKNSDIYIIVNNKFFTGDSKEIVQIHFETDQIKDRKNDSNVSIYESILSESEGLSNFFYEELITMAKEYKRGIDNNKYLDFLVKFGFADSLFELIDIETDTIRFSEREIPRIPDITKFKNLEQLIISKASLVDLHESIGTLYNLEMLILPKNKIKSLPKEIGNLKKLEFLNIIGNPIKDFPNEITYLDKSNGGSLHKIAVEESDIGADNYRRLKELLPTTSFD